MSLTLMHPCSITIATIANNLRIVLSESRDKNPANGRGDAAFAPSTAG
jgi:hypothetical protein